MNDECYQTTHGRLNTRPGTALFSTVPSPRGLKKVLSMGIVRFKDGMREKKCSLCLEWWPWDTEYYTHKSSHCRACEINRQRIKYFNQKTGATMIYIKGGIKSGEGYLLDNGKIISLAVKAKEMGITREYLVERLNRMSLVAALNKDIPLKRKEKLNNKPVGNYAYIPPVCSLLPENDLGWGSDWK
ncbi:MAG: hypothetical protein OEZ38_14045 [Gammaproteobacteria bacterium]|nr:hypothetical protein [Gammaproteobacteria bacterium]